MQMDLIYETCSIFRPFSTITIGGLIIGTSLYYNLFNGKVPSKYNLADSNCAHI